MTKNIFLGLCGFLVIMLAGQAFGEEDALVCIVEANYPPFTYTDKNGQPTGFDVEVLKRISQEIGMNITFKALPWEGTLDRLSTGEIDIVASGVTITEERVKKVSFSIPYWRVEQVIIVKNGASVTVEGIMSGRKALGVQKGTPPEKWFEKKNAYKAFNIDLRRYDSASLTVEALLDGRIAAAAMSGTTAKGVAGKKKIKILRSFGLPKETLGYAFRKTDKALIKKVNAALSKLMVTPFWGELLRKYELRE